MINIMKKMVVLVLTFCLLAVPVEGQVALKEVDESYALMIIARQVEYDVFDLYELNLTRALFNAAIEDYDIGYKGYMKRISLTKEIVDRALRI